MQDKTCLVTAAANGIGKATAISMARHGARVLATDIDREALSRLNAEHGIATCELDVTDPDQITSLHAAQSGFDSIVHCAGFCHDGTVEDVSDSEFDRTFALNVQSAFRLVRAFIPSMAEKGGGSIVFISSVASSIKGVPRRCVYGASKAALIGLMKSISADYVGKGIRANCICPGTIDTPSLHERMTAKGGDFETVRAEFVARQPIGRLGTADEIAQTAVFLSSGGGSFISGQAIAVDGGWTT